VIYINILQVISGNDNGGGANHVINICKSNISDMKSSILCIGSGPLSEKAKLNNIPVYISSFSELIKGKLVKVIKENHIDIVNFHGAKSNFLYGFIKNKINIPVTVTIHSDYRYDFLNSNWKKYIYTPLSKWGLNKFKNYICVSNNLKELLEKNNFLGNKYVVENGINIEKFNGHKNKENIRSKYNIDNNDFVYIVIARMHPIKNHDILIDAFKKCSLELHDIKLVLVGDGPLMESLKMKVDALGLNDKVIFTGFKDNPMDFINAADISILPSLSEGGAPPLVILESALVKKTVICSDVSDMKNIINKNNGFLINPLSVEDIYLKMKEAYINKDVLALKGNNLFNLVKERFDIENFWKIYYETYKIILSE